MSARVVHISYSSGGGAGKIASLLASTQNELGVSADLISQSDRSISEEPLTNPALAAEALIEGYVLSKPGSSLMTVLRGNRGQILNKLPSETEVVNLHWLPGVLAEKELGNLLGSGLKVVWTLHDMRPLTGACHYAQGCTRFQSQCANCPQSRALAHAVIKGNLARKSGMFNRAKFAFVAPSNGLVEAARGSSIAREARIEFIPNPYSVSGSGEISQTGNRDRLRLLLVAADAAESRKGLAQVIEWVRSLRQPAVELRVVGRNSHKFKVEGLVTPLGSMTQAQLRQEYESADALVFGSSEDNAPGVLVEAAAFSLPIICLDNQMANWLSNDGLKVFRKEELTVAISTDRATFPAIYREFLEARERHEVAKKYLELYESL